MPILFPSALPSFAQPDTPRQFSDGRPIFCHVEDDGLLKSLHFCVCLKLEKGGRSGQADASSYWLDDATELAEVAKKVVDPNGRGEQP